MTQEVVKKEANFPTDLTEELYGHYYAGYEQSKRDLPTFGKKRTARDKV